MYKTDYEAGKGFIEYFVKVRDKAKRAEEAYTEAIQIRSASSYAGDRVQTGRTGDPTFASAIRLSHLRQRHSRTETEYAAAIDRLDGILSKIRPRVLRLVVVLYYIDRRTVPEIAKMLIKKDGTKYSPETIKKLKHQALAEIGKAIKKAPE